MLREIGLATVILIVLTAVVVVLTVNQTAIVNYQASGVTGNVALAWGQNAEGAGEMSNDEVNAAEGMQSEATEEATPEATAEATEAASS